MTFDVRGGKNFEGQLFDKATTEPFQDFRLESQQIEQCRHDSNEQIGNSADIFLAKGEDLSLLEKPGQSFRNAFQKSDLNTLGGMLIELSKFNQGPETSKEFAKAMNQIKTEATGMGLDLNWTHRGVRTGTGLSYLDISQPGHPEQTLRIRTIDDPISNGIRADFQVRNLADGKNEKLDRDPQALLEQLKVRR